LNRILLLCVFLAAIIQQGIGERLGFHWWFSPSLYCSNPWGTSASKVQWTQMLSRIPRTVFIPIRWMHCLGKVGR
jgi:hypothetical protein